MDTIAGFLAQPFPLISPMFSRLKKKAAATAAPATSTDQTSSPTSFGSRGKALFSTGLGKVKDGVVKAGASATSHTPK